jgi:hypothetical protein
LGAEENKKLMQEIFAAIVAGDRKPYLAAMADDVTMRVTGQNSWSRTYKGKAALERGFYAHLRAVLAEPRRTIPHNFIADGDHVAVEARGDMRTKAGVPYENEYCLVYRLHNGKIVEIREYCDSGAQPRSVMPQLTTTSSRRRSEVGAGQGRGVD